MPLVTLYESNNIRYEFDPERKDTVLGRGGMGVVFKGRRIHNDTQRFEYVAIKVLFKDLPEDSVDRARREASIQIEHENLLRMYGLLESRDGSGRPTYHVISEYIDGIQLSELLLSRGRYLQSEAIDLVKKILLAVNMLHDRGYVHRDIDPSNIMICNGTGIPKLIDFGIARNTASNTDGVMAGTVAGQFIGKVAYAPPEQGRGEHWTANASSDIYLIGITLYELICGRVPFIGSIPEVIRGHREQPIQYDESINSSLRYVIDKAAAKLQIDRYQTASEFIVDLEIIERGGILPAKSTSNKGLIIAIVSAVLVFLLIVGGVMFMMTTNYNKTIDQAEQQLSVGLYQNALDIYKGAGGLINSSQTENQIEMLEILVPAVEAYNRSDYTVADKLFKKAARYDSPDAFYYLGEMCYEGIGTPRDYDSGFKYTSAAAEFGSELANYRLGIVYMDGLGVPIDGDKAMRYFEKASVIIDKGVDSNNPELLFIKGCMYLKGNQVEPSESLAIDCFKTAAELGYPQAQYELYMILADKDPVGAVEWLQKAVDNGYPKAEYQMCLVSWNNDNNLGAKEMIMRAATKNYSPALQTLGTWYSEALGYAEQFGFKGDDKTSHNYTEKALQYDFENFGAMYNLWYDYSNGIGVRQDLYKASTYKKMAIDKLNTLPYIVKYGKRIYDSSSAQAVWDKLTN